MSLLKNLPTSKILKVITILIASVSLYACGVHHSVQVSDRDQPPGRRLQTHYVAKGETLFSIAWRYGLDYRELAKFNRITPPYVIYPGQAINLAIGRPAAPQAATRTNPVTNSPPASARNTPVNNSPPPMATRPAGGVNAAKPAPVQAPRSENKTPPVSRPSAPPLAAGTPNWQWPVTGTVIARFQGSTGLNKGIDIAGNLGQPVLAAAPGQVVYAGTGLRGYGKLLIVKHNDTFLSAYAHNDTLFVKEGDIVNAGQKIAGMGASGTDRVKLHFEIRRQGTPVDPLIYLPRR